MSETEQTQQQNEGEIVVFLARKFGPSWRTSLVGYVNGLCVLVMALGQALPAHVPAAVVTIATTVLGALTSLGFIQAKDKRTTGAQ